MRQQVRDYETAQTDYERFDRETKAAEQEAEEIRMQAQQLTVAVERLNGDIRSITQQISGSESRIAVLENDILRNDESVAPCILPFRLARPLALGPRPFHINLSARLIFTVRFLIVLTDKAVNLLKIVRIFFVAFHFFTLCYFV